MTKPVCTVIGVGPGNGAAFARKFTDNGYRVALLARNEEYLAELAGELVGAVAYLCDVTDTDALTGALARIRDELGPVSVLIYNAGAGQFGHVEDTSEDAFEQAWRINALGCFVAARAVIDDMRELDGPSIIVIGATASLRGGANFTTFASAKRAAAATKEALHAAGCRSNFTSHLNIFDVLNGRVVTRRRALVRRGHDSHQGLHDPKVLLGVKNIQRPRSSARHACPIEPPSLQACLIRWIPGDNHG